MSSQAVKDLKMGFWIAGGFALFSVVLAIMLALTTKALGEA
jgi:hypothetical protein